MNILVTAWQVPCITVFSSGRYKCPCHTASSLDQVPYSPSHTSARYDYSMCSYQRQIRPNQRFQESAIILPPQDDIIPCSTIAIETQCAFYFISVGNYWTQVFFNADLPAQSASAQCRYFQFSIVLKQMENNTLFSQKIMHFWDTEKLLNAIMPPLCIC